MNKIEQSKGIQRLLNCQNNQEIQVVLESSSFVHHFDEDSDLSSYTGKELCHLLKVKSPTLMIMAKAILKHNLSGRIIIHGQDADLFVRKTTTTTRKHSVNIKSRQLAPVLLN